MRVGDIVKVAPHRELGTVRLTYTSGGHTYAIVDFDGWSVDCLAEECRAVTDRGL